ncbi:hypothetical protein V1514DRAFT_329891 [Lipomyces japonicus]|uniref:uncharacterized protein n=1 Tax=Lipomyces japonicus TaxID=56871 RepID=UPI0034CFE612
MSINWVMLSRDPNEGYVSLPNETTLFRAPYRTSFKLRPVGNPSSSVPSSNTYPGHAAAAGAAGINRPIKLDSSQGSLILSSHRLIYLPDATSSLGPSPGFLSFAAPLGNVHDAHVTQPWFGPNQWSAVIVPVVDGGLTQNDDSAGRHHPFELLLTFKDGGAFEFQDKFERIRERQQEGLQHIDELPQYEPGLMPQRQPEVLPPPADDELPPPYQPPA